MKIEQIYTGCLAQGAYYIESNGEAVVIDPLRETAPYLQMAEYNGAKIKYILETHFHADFVSGHLSLAKECGAPIIYGPGAKPAFEATIAEDGQELQVGDISIKVLHTPGHTLESTTYLLRDENNKDHAIFTGDTLFLGDVGRPDLAQKQGSITKEDLAGMLYDSLRHKIMPLADEVIVYPGHGAGSACGKNMMKETVDTLGNQKKMNYALREDMSREEFIREVTEGLSPPPGYFPLNVKMNREGYDHFNEVLDRGLHALAPDDFEQRAQESGAIVLDVRHQKDFVRAFIPGSIFIGLDGTFAPWVGAVLKDTSRPILLVAPAGREEEAVTRLARVGFDHVLGYLAGGMENWQAAGKAVDSLKSVPATELAQALEQGHPRIVDVRKEGEYNSGHIDGAQLLPLDFLEEHKEDIPRDQPFYIHCAGGYRSVIAASLMKTWGISAMTDVAGGFKAIREAGIDISSKECTAKS